MLNEIHMISNKENNVDFVLSNTIFITKKKEFCVCVCFVVVDALQYCRSFLPFFLFLTMKR